MKLTIECMNAEWPGNPHFNLAFEEAFYTLIKQGGEDRAVLRFWRNDKTIVIGRYQCAALEVNSI